MEPNGKWKAGGHFNLDEMYADTEHVYVEVAFDDENYKGICKEDFTIRTMIAKPVEETKNDWAFIGCR